MKLTIYDMDGTLLSGTTYTPFLLFAARRLAPWRLVLVPAWFALLVAHKLRLLSRTRMKHLGMRLLVGPIARDRLDHVTRDFATKRMSRLFPGARAALAQDRQEGRQVVIATAAYGLYAEHVARALAVEHLVASGWDPVGPIHPNCYGPEKLARVEAWLAEHQLSAAEVRFVSDSFADAPLLDRAQEAWFVTTDPRKAARAQARGWRVVDFSR